MEKSTERELWVGYMHPVNKTISVRWFESDSEHTATQKAESFVANSHQCLEGKILANVTTAEQAIEEYNKKD